MSNLKAISPKLSNTIIQHMEQAKLLRPVEPHYSCVALSTNVFEMYGFMKVLSNLNHRSRSTISLTRFSKFAITKNANTLDNHEDFNRVVTGLGRAEQKKTKRKKPNQKIEKSNRKSG